MPAAWARASASAIGIAIRSDFAEPHPLARMSASSVLPGTYSMTMKSIAVRRLDLVDGDDVRMVEGGGGARLLHEAPAAGLVGHPLRGQDLDRDLAARRVSRAR